MINVIRDGDEIEIWTDTEIAPRDGRCVASGKTFDEAKTAAINALADDLRALCLTTPADVVEVQS